MRVIVEGNSVDDLKVTFFITNAEEKSSFHDRVAISICEGAHDFIGHVYACKDRSPEPVEYDIPIKSPWPF